MIEVKKMHKNDAADDDQQCTLDNQRIGVFSFAMPGRLSAPQRLNKRAQNPVYSLVLLLPKWLKLATIFYHYAHCEERLLKCHCEERSDEAISLHNVSDW